MINRKKLIINDIYFGTCEQYKQDQENRVWIFNAGRNDIIIPFDSIKYFHSALNLEIDVNGDISIFA